METLGTPQSILVSWEVPGVLRMYQSSPAAFWLLWLPAFWLWCDFWAGKLSCSLILFLAPFGVSFYFYLHWVDAVGWSPVLQPGFALPGLWLIWLQPQTLAFQCSATQLPKKFIRRHWNCITGRKNGNMLCPVTKHRSRLLGKVEKTLPVPGKTRVGCSPVVSGS